MRVQREQAMRVKLDAADVTAAPPPVVPSDGRPESMIEQRFPHVAKMLVAMWPSPAFALYVQRMVVTDRETRAGFPRDVIEDLLLLDTLNDALLRKAATRKVR